MQAGNYQTQAEQLEPELETAALEAANEIQAANESSNGRAPVRRPVAAGSGAPLRAPLPRPNIVTASNQDSSTTSRTSNAAKAVLTIGPGLNLEGKISNCEVISVEGSAAVSVEANTMHILRSGRVSGEAVVKEADIEGHFDGQINVAGTLVVRASGIVKGDISYGRLQIDEGGRIIGEIKLCSSDDNSRRSSKRQADG